MKNANLILTFVIATILLSGVCFSLAAAQDSQSIPRFNDNSDQPPPDVPDNSTIAQDGEEILYATDDENQPQRDPSPDILDAEDANLIAGNPSSDPNLPLEIVAVVLTLVVGALAAFICYTKFFKNKK
jgi:hypothetical protein